MSEKSLNAERELPFERFLNSENTKIKQMKTTTGRAKIKLINDSKKCIKLGYIK